MKVRRAMGAALWGIRLLVGAAVAVVLMIVVRWCGPDFEDYAFPVLARQSVGEITRWDNLDGGVELCWTWRFDKRRAATAIDSGWTLAGGGKVWPYLAIRTVADSGEVTSALQQRPVGPGQFSRKCAGLPPELARQPVRITGFALYRTERTGAYWAVRQPFAEGYAP